MDPPFSSESTTRQQQLFEEALELGREERKAFLERECGDDLKLRQELEELLSESQPVLDELDDLEQNLILPALESLRKDPKKLNVWKDSLRESGRMADSLIGKKISHYEIRQLIGRGGMGMVYRAYDQALDREVALKFLPPSFGNDTAAKERFIQEAKAASGLDHPNIAAVHEIGETEDGQMFIAMGYYPGETLKAIIEKGPIPVDQALDITIQIASALKEAHGHGIIHRDIKPGNFIMSPDGTIHLLDFGLAKLSYASGYTQIGLMMGTIAYMSPEQAKGRSVDHRTDIWSLGVVLHEMVTGKRPFGGEDAPSAIRAILQEDPRQPEIAGVKISKSLRQLIWNCLSKHPDERYADVGELLEDLERIRQGLAPRKTSRNRAGKWRFTGWRMAVSLTAMGVLIVWILSLLLKSSSKIPDEVAEAIHGLEVLHERNPDTISPILEIADLYSNYYQYDKAMYWLRKGHVLQPRNEGIHWRIIGILSRLGDSKVASWWTEHFLEINPDSYLSKGLEIRLHLYRGELDQAADKILAMDPEELDFHQETRDLVLDKLVDAGYQARALELVQYAYPQAVAFKRLSGFGAKADVVELSIGDRNNRVLKIDPGPPTEPGTGKLITSMVLHLPDAAKITSPANGQETTIVSFKIGRLRQPEQGLPIHVIFGLASGDEAPEFPFFPYANFSVQARIETDGTLDVRDGNDYADLGDFPMDPGVAYEFWFVIDNADMSFSLYAQGGRQFPDRTLLFENARYRRPAAGALDHFIVNVRGGEADDPITARAPIFFDDLKVFQGSHISATGEHAWILVDDFENVGTGDWTVARESWDPALGMETVSRYILVACALHAGNEREQASRILDTLTRYLDVHGDQETPEYSFARMRIHALRGEGEQALEALRSLVDSGQMNGYWNGILDGYAFAGLEVRDRMVRLLVPWQKELDRQLVNIEQMGAVAVFKRLTGDSLLSEPGHFFAASWGDFDGDGYIDLALAALQSSTTAGHIQLYRNQGDKTFTRIVEGVVPNDIMDPTTPVWVDPDNDGDLDLFVTTYGTNRFYHNKGNGSFTRETRGNWLNSETISDAPLWGDYDNDGWIDLFVTNIGSPNSLYRNMGNGRMEPVPWDTSTGPSHGAEWSDIDLDGDLDLFVSGSSHVLYRNDGNGTFTWISPEEGGLPKVGENISFSMADYDNDGDMDVAYATSKTNPSEMIYRNDGRGGFVQELNVLPPLEEEVFTITGAWGDYDNDGWQDLFLTTIGAGSHLYHNEGDGTFIRIPDSQRVNSNREAAFPTWVDIDNDGDLDLFTSNGAFSSASEPCDLFINHSGPNNWIGLTLVGNVSNVQGIGARVHCTATIRGQILTQMREHGQGQYASPRLHFGLGDAQTIDLLRIEWPSGIIQEINDVAVNQILTIMEPDK